MNNKEYKPEGAQVFGSAVYVGVVIAVTVLFISMILTAFPKDAYVSRVVMVIAGLLIGASSIAFPVALHTWTVEKVHRRWTIGFYYGEVAIMAVNAVVSFMTLLDAHTTYQAPKWAVLYEPFSVGAVVYTLLAWGTVFLMDPEHQRIQQERQLNMDFEAKTAKLRDEFLDSIEGEAAVASFATAQIQEYLATKTTGKKHFGVAVGSVPVVNTPFEVKQAVSPSPLPESDDES